MKFAIVTGSNVGIGMETTAGLREEGFHVLMACRSQAKCIAAKAELDRRRLAGSCECAQLDLSDCASVRSFAEGIKARGENKISLLVNNAGVMGVGPTADGTNGHLLPNHYGPFLLTRLLLPLMAAHGRVVNVGSEAHRRGSFTTSRQTLPGRANATLEASELERSCSNWYSDYARSKLGNLLFTAELSRRLQERGSSVTAYCVSPGRVNTNIFGNVPGLLRQPLQLLAGLFFQTPKQGARTVLMAATASELQGKHVLYMHDMKEANPSPAAKDAALAADVWQHSVHAVGLSKDEDACLWPRG